MNLGNLSFKGIGSVGFRRLRTAIAAIFVLLLALAAAAFFRYANRDPVLPIEELGGLAENESAVTLYYDFLQGMKSGEITKTRYSTQSLYDIVSCTEETYVFSTYQNKKRVLTYQQRQPLVFWHYPEPGYYDGTYYYYKHGDDWFIDTFHRFYNQIQPDALGIPADSISQYRITDSMVYHRPDGGYQAYVYAQKRGDPDNHAEVIGVLDENFRFSYIEITVTYPEDKDSRKDQGREALKAATGVEEPITEKMIIKYEQVNELIEMKVPESLTEEEMAYLQEEYKKSQQEQ